MPNIRHFYLIIIHGNDGFFSYPTKAHNNTISTHSHSVRFHFKCRQFNCFHPWNMYIQSSPIHLIIVNRTSNSPLWKITGKNARRIYDREKKKKKKNPLSVPFMINPIERKIISLLFCIKKKIEEKSIVMTVK